MEGKKVSDNKLKKIEESVVKLLSLMGSGAEVSASLDEEGRAVQINLDTEDETGLLIGRQ